MSSRIFLIRHGETEGSRAAQHISTTDHRLSTVGEKQVEWTREQFVGEGKLIDPKRISRVYISPMKRDRQTCEILRLGMHHHQHFYDRTTKETSTTGAPPVTGDVAEATIQITPWLGEWNYGEYEGLTTDQIWAKRKEAGLDKERSWSIWDDGCPGGETPQQVSDRLDQLIAEMRDVLQSTTAAWPGGRMVPHISDEPRDIVCIASSQALAALAMRWVKLPLKCGMRLLIETAGVAILGFEEEDLMQPAIILGRRPVAQAVGPLYAR